MLVLEKDITLQLQCGVLIKKKIEKSILNNVRKIDFFTKDLRKVFVEWNGNDYDPFYNINDYNDLKLAESMLKKNIIK